MQTNITSADPKTVKAWSASLALDTNLKSYFSKKFVGQGDNSIIEIKTELESEPGDLINFDLSVSLRGDVTVGDARLKGKEENLRFFSDQVLIDQMRKSVSAGGRMSRKRTKHSLRKVARDRLSDYWAQYMDQFTFIYLSGARGINEDYYQPLGWTGHAGNPIQAPDADHILYGGSATSKSTITTSDKMTRTVIERAQTYASMIRALNPDVASMRPVSIEGEGRYVHLMSEFQAFDLRVSDTAGWLEMNKALVTAEGKNSPIFKGGLGMLNNTVLHAHESVVRFSDYGAGTNLPASRSLFMGRQAGVVAYGTAGQGMGRFSWFEETDDFSNLINIAAGCIMGMKKTRFNGRDYGVLAIDTYAASVK